MTGTPVSTILIVDDDRETCRFIAELLAAVDRRIESAHEPEAALRTAQRGGWDLLISDINLNAPISGLDLLRTFKEFSAYETRTRYGDVPVPRRI